MPRSVSTAWLSRLSSLWLGVSVALSRIERMKLFQERLLLVVKVFPPRFEPRRLGGGPPLGGRSCTLAGVDEVLRSGRLTLG